MALEALSDFDYDKRMEAITVLRVALASNSLALEQVEQPAPVPEAHKQSAERGEPVAVYVGETWCGSVVRLYDDLPLETPLYTRPQAREREQPAQQEPVGEVSGYYERGFTEHKTLYGKLHNQDLPIGTKLYTRPAERQSRSDVEPLTDEEIEQCMKQAYSTVQGRNLEHAFARAIEAAHQIGVKK